ncbi:MAG: amidohydrolase [Thermodesulfobacteriota bacterium]
MTQAEVHLLVCGTVYTGDAANTVIADGGVAVAGDTIVAVDSAATLKARYPQAQVVSCGERGLVMPGLINAHCHSPMTLLRGLADDLPLMEWLTEHIFPREGRFTAEIVDLGTRLAALEMIKGGTTSFCDMYLFAKDVARAASDCGMRAWVGEVLYDFPSPNYGELENGFAYVAEMYDEFAGHPLVTVTANAHAVYSCSSELLVRLKQQADDHASPFVIHLAETKGEVEGCLAKFGKRPVAHLADLGLLDERLVADHCVALNSEEIETLARKGVKVAHCPESNMKLASGVAPVAEMLAAGVTVGLGTDGAASNNDLDMFGEMDSGAKLQKVHNLDPTLLTAPQVLAMATSGGATLLGAADAIGSLEVGKKADIIVLDLDKPHLTPLYNIPSLLVYAASGADVVHSVIGGRLLMENRQVLSLDEVEIMARCQEMADRLRG